MVLRRARSVFSKCWCTLYVPRSSRSPAPFRRSELPPIWCSIKQVDSYRTAGCEESSESNGSSLYQLILTTTKNPNLAAAAVLDQRDKQKRLSRSVLSHLTKELRKSRRFRQSLEVYDWMSAQGDRFKLSAVGRKIKLDVISKVYGFSTAEEYFSALPDELKEKHTYSGVLIAYLRSQKKEKAESLLEIMNMGEHEKVNKIINKMKEKNIRFGLYQYNAWMINCAAMGNLEEIESVWERMISDKINPNWTTYSTLASIYTKTRNFEKAESYIKEIELRATDENRGSFHYLLGHYSSIGKKEEVYRIWKLYKSKFRVITNTGYRIVLSSLVKSEDIEGAEAIYEEWLSTTSDYDQTICNILIGYYSRCGDPEKAKLLLDRFVEKRDAPKPDKLKS